MRPLISLIVVVAGLLLALVPRMLIHRRQTGDWGFVGFSRARGQVATWAALLFALAVLLAPAAPLVALLGAGSAAYLWSPGPGTDLLAVLATVLGLAATLAAQRAMGRSWRIGVCEQDATLLVTGGPFRQVRNPIFTAMVLSLVALPLVLPTALALAAPLCLLLAVELQVRGVEEPYLQRRHGAAYQQYGAATGRFLPGLGRLGRPGRPGRPAV